jgi:hypothetical protein
MKAGIITYHVSNNYGAILQAYALQTVVEQLGHTAEIVNYIDCNRRTTSSVFDSWLKPKGLVTNLFAILRYPQLRRQHKRVAAFRDRYLHTSTRTFFSSDELRGCRAEYDAFICGSDQVWQPSADRDRICAYYLGFVGQHEGKKISYAPSFGVSSITDSFEREIAPLVNDISALSVREETGRDIVEKATGRRARVVLDPTLLLASDQWTKVSSQRQIDFPYILVYSTSQRGLFSDLVKHAAKVTGLPVVVISGALNLIPGTDRVVYDADPSEFVSLFANAECVCTNSFHGTAFSLIFRRPFWGVPHPLTNSRIADLLRRIDLSGRQVHSVVDLPKIPLEIDYTQPALLLERLKQESIDFLKMALESTRPV